MSLIGYLRIPEWEDGAEDLAALEKAGCEKIYTDHGGTRKLDARPEWDACLGYLRRGDVLVVLHLSQIMRSLTHMLEIGATLEEIGATLLVLRQGIDERTMHVLPVLAAVAEGERDLVRERTMEGLSAARARGRKGGRKEKLSPLQARRMLEMLDERGEDGSHAYTPTQVAKTYGVSRGTLYRYRANQLSAAGQANSNGENGEKQQRQEGAGEHGEANLNGA